MDHYLDIRLRLDPEVTSHQVLSALFSKLHIALVKQDLHPIGVSFPEASVADDGSTPPDSRTLGSCLRLHGAREALRRLMEVPWLQGVRDHLNLGDVLPVPAQAMHRVVSRVQAKSSPERLRRRLQRRHGVDAAEAQRRIPDSVAKSLALPFLTLSSTSTAQRFHLFLQHGPLQKRATEGAFNGYGLSAQGTIPWF